MIPRHLTSRLLAALSDTPVVFLTGPRQAGKSTLAQWLAEEPHPARYVTLDDATVLAAAGDDPAGFLSGLEGPVVLDEVQRAPDLFLAIKASVDRDRRPGRFLLTGSANALMLPRLSEALVGRMEVLTLWPLAQAEIEKRPPDSLVDALFSDAVPTTEPGEARAQVLRRALRGGYPEVLERPSPERRRAWWGSYATTIIQRDVRDLAQIEGLTELPRLLALLAAGAGGLLNFAELSRSSGIPQTTLKRYLALLEATFLLGSIPAWSSNLGKRLVKSPKLMLTDTGLMGHMLGASEGTDVVQAPWLGALVETFVAMELRKHMGWSATAAQLHHLRTQTGQEVDLVLEDDRGRLVGVEVKASATVGGADFAGLRALAEQTGERFHRGVVLYAGREAVPFGERLHALPISALWRPRTG